MPPVMSRRPIAGRPNSRTPQDGKPRVQFYEDPYSYVLNFDALAIGAVQNQSIQILAAADFKWIKSTYQADVGGVAFTTATQPIPNVTIQITESGTSKQLFSNPIPLAAFFGTGQLPFILPIAKIFSARSSVAFQVTNYDSANTYNLQIALHGMNMFEQSQD